MYGLSLQHPHRHRRPTAGRRPAKYFFTNASLTTNPGVGRGVVGRGELAPAQDGNPQRPEVPGRDDANRGDGAFAQRLLSACRDGGRSCRLAAMPTTARLLAAAAALTPGSARSDCHRLLIEDHPALAGVARRRQRHFHRQHVVLVDAVVGAGSAPASSAPSRPAPQSRMTVIATWQTTRTWRMRGECVTPRPPARSAGDDGLAGDQHGGHEPDDQAGERPTGRARRQHAAIDEQCGHAQQIRRREGDQRVEAPGAPAATPSAPPAMASSRLSITCCWTIARRPAPSELRMAISRRRDADARQQQVGDVEAGDRQQHADGGVENQQRGGDLPGQRLAQRRHRHAGLLVELVGRRQPRGDRVHLGARRRQCRVRARAGRRRS